MNQPREEGVRPETIKERIERETREKMDAGRSRQAIVASDPEEVRLDSEYVRGYNDGRLAAANAQTTTPADAPKYAAEPGSWTMQALEDITGILGARGQSYTTEDEFENFNEQAKMGDQSMRQVFRGALGQKLARERATWARLQELTTGDDDPFFRVERASDQPAYDALMLQWLDSIRDICGYALLMFGWAKRFEGSGE